MKEIKTKDKYPKDIKEHHRGVDVGRRMRGALNKSQNEIQDGISEDSSTLDYGENKIKEVTTNIKDEVVHDTRKVGHSVVDHARNHHRGGRGHNPPPPPEGRRHRFGRRRFLDEPSGKIKNIVRHNIDNSPFSTKKLNLGQRLAMRKARNSRYSRRKATEVMKSAIKGIMASFKSLIVAIAFGFGMATCLIIIICLLGLLVASIFGIFFSSHKTGNNSVLMKDCIVELDKEMDDKIRAIEDKIEHDEVIIISNKAEWKDVLSIYSVKVSNENNGDEVMTINSKKKKILSDIFWDMNKITSTVKEEEYTSTMIEELGDENDKIEDAEETEKSKLKKVLYITIDSISIDEEMINQKFSYEQYKQFNEIYDDEYASLWNTVIYGEFEDITELSEWKQKGKEWSNIKMGTSNYNIGKVGCLVTSIAIQIKKSGVQTDIEPFNPGTFVIALNNVYGISNEANLSYGAIEKVVPNFVYQGHISLRGKNKEGKYNELKKYYDDGYYLVAEVYGAQQNQHWVAIDTMSAGTIKMFDPATNFDDMWETYDYRDTSQFVYFKAIK